MKTSLKMDNVTNNVKNTQAINVLNQEIQDCYNQRDQKYIGCKYDGDLKQISLELVPDIINEEEEKEDVFINVLTVMINGIIYPTHLWKKMKQGTPTPSMLLTVFSTSQRPNKTGNRRQ